MMRCILSEASTCDCVLGRRSDGFELLDQFRAGHELDA